LSDRNLWTEKYDATAEKDPKFGSKPKRCSENVWHQSTLEARRCTELHLMQKGGLIRELEAHPQHRYRLECNGVHICDYLADFVYVDTETGAIVAEDTKGFRTREFIIKSRLMLACHQIQVVEIGKERGRRRFRT
jgi:hypothetical protein